MTASLLAYRVHIAEAVALLGAILVGAAWLTERIADHHFRTAHARPPAASGTATHIVVTPAVHDGVAEGWVS